MLQITMCYMINSFLDIDVLKFQFCFNIEISKFLARDFLSNFLNITNI